MLARLSLKMMLLAVMILVSCTPANPTPPPVTLLPPTPTLTPLNITFELGGQVFGSPATNLMNDARMTWIKRQVVYRQGDNPDLTAPDILTAHNQGFKILLSVIGDKGQLANNPTNYYADFATFLRGVALHNPDAIQVWNEPNIDREWPAGTISGGTYTQMLKTAYDAIKAANPNVMVISAAPAPTGFFGGNCAEGGCDDNIFIRQMADAGAENYMDCVGIHYNEGIISPDETSGDPRGNSSHYTRYYKTMVNLYTHTFPTKPLCFDELGFLTAEGYGQLPLGFEWASEVTIQDQAAWLGRAAALSKQGGRIRLMIVWNFNSTAFGADPQAGYAIVRRDGTCPACATLRGAMN
jgi:hypothetical protein